MKRFAGFVSLSMVAGCLAAALLLAGPASANPGASGGSVSSGPSDAINGSTSSGCGVAINFATASGACGPAAGATPPAAATVPTATPAAAAVAQPGANLALTGSDSRGLVRSAFLLMLAGTAVVTLTRRRSHSPA